MHQPLIVHANRRKAARGVVAALALAVASVLAGEREHEYDTFMLFVGIVWAGVFVLAALKLAKAARSSEPVLVADDLGIHSPGTDVSVPWSEVVAVDHEVGRTSFDSTTHTLKVSVRDAQAVLRRRVGDARCGRVDRAMLVRHDRLDIHLDDLSMPPAKIAAAVEERFRAAAVRGG